MPIYEYQCSDCQSKFEMLRPRDKADAPAACKHCNGSHTSRAVSLFAAHSDGRMVVGSGAGCGNCAPSSACATCRSH